MRCATESPTFRLLDWLVGWDQASSHGLIGLDDSAGVRLATADGGSEGLQPEAVLPYFPPKFLAPGCGPCDWYLLATQRDSRLQLLRWDQCANAWSPAWPSACDPGILVEPVGVYAAGHRLAVADAEAGLVYVWEAEGAKLLTTVPAIAPSVIALAPWNEIVIVDRGSSTLLTYAIDGRPLALHDTGIPGDIEGITFGSDCTIWILERDRSGGLRLWRGVRDRLRFRPADPEELESAVQRTSLTAASDRGFCLTRTGPGGVPVTSCFGWDGIPLDPGTIRPSPPPRRERFGQLLTRSLDSGIPRCRWHRVRIEASVPAGTSVHVAISTSEDPDPPPQGDPWTEEPPWTSFPAGVPHPADWQKAPDGSLDFLVDHQPPGRYLFVRIRLGGDGRATPRIRRVRLDFPRATSMDLLPDVYRQDPRADDFGERFLSLFDAWIADLDRHIERSPALLDANGVPDEALPWLGSLLGLAFDPSWGSDVRRRVFAALPDLYRMRGTPWAIRRAVQLVFGVEPVLVERSSERSWASLAPRCKRSRARIGLGSSRLFGRASSRFTLGASSLSRGRVWSHGSAVDDAIGFGAYRFRVLVPARWSGGAEATAKLRRLVASQSPAHTVPDVYVGDSGFVVGARAAVGVDTALTSPARPPVLGRAGSGEGVRLGRRSVLWHGPGGRVPGVRLGQASAVGIHTITE